MRYAAVSPLTPPPTITTSCLADEGGRENTLPSRTWWQIRLSSPSTVGAELGASPAWASSERSTGHPAVTAPATTNLMKSLRFAFAPFPFVPFPFDPFPLKPGLLRLLLRFQFPLRRHSRPGRAGDTRTRSRPTKIQR